MITKLVEAMAHDLAKAALKGTKADDMDITELTDEIIAKCKTAIKIIREVPKED